MIPESFIEELLARVDIVDVVGAHVPLKRAGAGEFSARCPFHQERTPSFTVSAAKQFYHCFGCGAHGTALRFLMEYRRLPFPEAVEELAGSVGMEVPQRDGGQARQGVARGLREVLQRAAEHYARELLASADARRYLDVRGINGDMIRRFGIGWSGEGARSLARCFADYDSAAVLEEAGLVSSNARGRYDRFRQRIMLPIHDGRGQIIGFGGRVLGEGEPKYLNSPETAVFSKGRELYGAHLARQAIGSAGRALVVEGYLDVVALHQAGLEFTVATLGTATTTEQIRRLYRGTDEIIFCFDGDAAGRRAAWKALNIGLGEVADGKVMRFLFLPEGEDPDSFVRGQGADAFLRRMDGAEPLSEFMVNGLAGQADLGVEEGKAAFVRLARPMLERLAGPTLRALLIRRLGDVTGLGEAGIGQLLEGGALARSAVAARVPVGASRQLPNLERQMLVLLLSCPDAVRSVDLGGVDPGGGPQAALLVQLVDYLNEAASPVVSAALLERFHEAIDACPGLAEALARAEALSLPEVVAELGDAIGQYRRLAEKRLLRERIDAFMQRPDPPSSWSEEDRQMFKRLTSQLHRIEGPAGAVVAGDASGR